MPKLLLSLYQLKCAVSIYHKLYPLFLYRYIRSVNELCIFRCKMVQVNKLTVTRVKELNNVFTGYKDINEILFYITITKLRSGRRCLWNLKHIPKLDRKRSLVSNRNSLGCTTNSILPRRKM